MILEWQRLEHRVSVLARTRCMAFASACESDLPEAEGIADLRDGGVVTYQSPRPPSGPG